MAENGLKDLRDRMDQQSRVLEQHGKNLDRQKEELVEIKETLQKIAVQDERIRTLQSQTQKLWEKMDQLAGNDGAISQIQKFQASCPRGHIKYLWIVVVPMGFALLGVGAKIFNGIFMGG